MCPDFHWIEDYAGFTRAAFLSVSMHFIRGWPWQPSWSRVISGVSMRRGSSNKVVEQRSSSSNTTAPTDTPSGSELAYSVLFCQHISYLCLLAYSSLLTKKQNQAARKILRFLLRCRHRWGVTINTATLQTCHSIHITYTNTCSPPPLALTALMLIVGVVLLFLWSPLMDQRPMKRVSISSLFSPSFSPDACLHVSGDRGRGRCGLPSLPPSLFPPRRGQRNDVATSAWLTDRRTVLAHGPAQGHVPTDVTGEPQVSCLPCKSVI